MNKSGAFGMQCHQISSFAAPLMRLSRCEAVFWPGCALMNLDPVILQKTAAVLRRAEPSLGLSSCCCGQPTRYLFPQQFPRRQAELRALIEKKGVRRIYTACPNCARQLQSLGAEILPLWHTLARVLRPEDLSPAAPREVTLHDPCPMRQQAPELDAVRELLSAAGITVREPAHNRQQTLCCGNIGMLRATDPAKSAAMRQQRLAEFPPELPIASPCEGCLDAFRGEGRQTAHLLELLFGQSKKRGWGNRLAFTRSVPAFVPTEPIPLILDCDNTMGVAGCDVDDGLALLYLLGSPQVNLLGITCSYGNNFQEVTYQNTLRLLKKWGRTDIPVFRGSEAPGQLSSPAADFLAESARRYDGALRLLVTGSTTNLRGALEKDPLFLRRLHSLSFMGGVTEPLFVGGLPMQELNLSIDWPSTLAILRGGHDIRIATAQNCLASFFPRQETLARLRQKNTPLAHFLEQELDYWFRHNEENWNISGIVNWDVMAAAQLIHPELFELEEVTITPSEQPAVRGLLMGDGTPLRVLLPRIRQPETYRQHIYDTYFSARIALEENEV